MVLRAAAAIQPPPALGVAPLERPAVWRPFGWQNTPGMICPVWRSTSRMYRRCSSSTCRIQEVNGNSRPAIGSFASPEVRQATVLQVVQRVSHVDAVVDANETLEIFERRLGPQAHLAGIRLADPLAEQLLRVRLLRERRRFTHRPRASRHSVLDVPVLRESDRAVAVPVSLTRNPKPASRVPLSDTCQTGQSGPGRGSALIVRSWLVPEEGIEPSRGVNPTGF